MMSWAEETVSSVSDSNSFYGCLGNLGVLTVPCTFYLCLIPLNSYCVNAPPFKNMLSGNNTHCCCCVTPVPLSIALSLEEGYGEIRGDAVDSIL